MFRRFPTARYVILAGLAAAFCWGCAQPPGSMEGVPVRSSDAPVAMDQTPKELAGQPGQAGDDSEATGSEAEPIARKIIYDATVEMRVKVFAEVPGRIAKLVDEHGGYIASSSILGSDGDPRSGTWKIRVPVARHGNFLAAVDQVGQVTRQTLTSQEVTAEYYDLAARLKNKQNEEERLLRHLDEDTDDLEQILKIEHELSRVRGEIEQMQGRLRLLQNLTAMSTVTLHVEEILTYVADVPFTPVTFGQRISQAWQQTTAALLQFGQGLVVVLVVLAPWLGVLAVFVVPVVWYFRRRAASRAAG